MRVLWDTNVVVAGLVFSRGQAARALYSGWERWPHLLITQWIDAEAARILAAKFHAPEVWPGVRPRFLILPDPPDATIAEWADVVRDPSDAPIAAACVWHQLTHLVTGDKDLLEDPAVLTRLDEYGIHVLSVAHWLDMTP
ncbi:MAG: hypothetical protein C7B45_17530 [Sulfobacillus acidophilus]|uniref:PIN domain-containing protein n=1 Tax=Sulfobacillus acidophilus TaxID=53633 RepID=A0A2T2WCG3_9FIRM|nr:MAG: hypothetical protein C7B45_17530 [Sulfobacillus acidophilus]